MKANAKRTFKLPRRTGRVGTKTNTKAPKGQTQANTKHTEKPQRRTGRAGTKENTKASKGLTQANTKHTERSQRRTGIPRHDCKLWFNPSKCVPVHVGGRLSCIVKQQ